MHRSVVRRTFSRNGPGFGHAVAIETLRAPAPLQFAARLRLVPARRAARDQFAHFERSRGNAGGFRGGGEREEMGRFAREYRRANLLQPGQFLFNCGLARSEAET